MLGQYFAAPGVELALPNDVAQAGPLEAQLEPADAAEK